MNLIDAYGDPIENDRHEVFVTDDGIVPTCDLCGGPQRIEGDNWNGDTGNHYSCEEGRPDPGFMPYDPDDDSTKVPERGYR